MDVEVSFPSDSRVRARSKDLVVEVGPPPDQGGDPETYGPFDLLLCALATCTGYQVLSFLRARGLPIADAGLHVKGERNESSHVLETISVEICVAQDLSEKYDEALIRATELCPIKAQMRRPSEISVSVVPAV